MRKSKLLVLSISLLLFFSSNEVNAFTLTNEVVQQNKQISGKVYDSFGDPLPGVTVLIKGTTIGTITDVDGNYTISTTSSDAILEFSFIGMKKQEIQVGNSAIIDVTLEYDIIGLEEVIAVGYGSQKKKELTGSVTGLKEEELLHGSQTSPIGMIQGKVAGLNITKPNGGDPNGSYVYQIRGTSSLTGNTTPLIIIDGIPQGDLSAIPQDEIESIDILKDGSAAAIYGTRGTNGVILVTTKKGKGEKSKFDYNAYISVPTIQHTPDIMNREQFLEFGGTDRGSNTDWVKEITRNPITHSHNVALTGGANEFNYRASVSYKNNPGLEIKSGFEDIVGRLAVAQKLLNDKIKIDLDATYHLVSREYSRNDAFKHAQHYNPTAPVYDSGFDEWGGYYQLDIENYSNPVARIKQRSNNDKEGAFQGSFRVGWNIFEGFKAEVFGSLFYSDKNNGNYSSREIYNTSSYGYASRSYNNNSHKTIESTINYVKAFGEHNLVALAGYSFENNFRESFNVNNSNFNSDIFSYYDLQAGSNLLNDPTQGMVGSSVSQSSLASFFGRINYIFRDKYLVSGSVRHEGSTRLGINNKWGTFPAVSFGWIASNEGFLSGSSAIEFLKFRFGYGVTGNMPSNDYLTLALMGVIGRVYDHSSQTWINAYGPTQNVNKDLKWEKKGEWNLGFDLTSLNNRINLTVDAYLRKVSDLLYNYKVPTPPFQYQSIMANVGEATAKGLEFTIGGTPIKSSKFNWNTSYNISFNKNRIDKFNDEIYQTDWIETGNLSASDLGGLERTSLIRLVPGGKAGNFYLPVFEGFNDDGTWKFKDVDGDGEFTFDVDREFVGNAQPDFIAGWNNDFSYGNFELSASLRAVVGNDVYNVSRMALENRTIAGTEKNMLVSVMDIPLNDAALVSDYYLEDGSFLKLDNVTLAYNVPLSKNRNIEKLRFYITGQNLFTITNYKGIDPEVNMVDIDNMGIERTSFYPSVRLFVAGVNVSF